MCGSSVEILLRKSYLDRVRKSVGTQMFQSLYAVVDGREVDILNGGRKSCALFMSTVLVGFGLVRSVHATVDSTIADMEASGWVRIERPRVGCVVLWKDYLIDGEAFDHLGFYLGNGRAISNSSDQRAPREHDYRIHKVAARYWHPRLA